MRDIVMRLQFSDDRPQASIRMTVQGQTDMATIARWLFTSGEREGLRAVGVFNSSDQGGEGHWPLLTEGDFIVTAGNVDFRKPRLQCPLEYEDSIYDTH